MSKEYLKTPGIYEALIIGAEATNSKKGDPMLVITFKQLGGTGGEINSYFVPKYDFMAKRLAELKLAVGVSPAAKKDDLLGKKLIIEVAMQKVKPGQEKINEKTNLPYPPNSEVVAYLPFKEPAQYMEQDITDKLPF